LKTGLILDIKTELDLSDLVSGVYTLRFQSEQASLLTQKLIKL
jgi:hypothetical protein